MSILTILVDDDDLTLFLHKEFIKANMFSDTIHSFINGKEALLFIDGEKETLKEAVVFLDINMPLFNGWDFLEELQGKGFKSKLKVVVLTSSVNTADREKAEKYSEVIRFLEKPLDNEKLEELKKENTLSKYFIN